MLSTHVSVRQVFRAINCYCGSGAAFTSASVREHDLNAWAVFVLRHQVYVTHFVLMLNVQCGERSLHDRGGMVIVSYDHDKNRSRSQTYVNPISVSSMQFLLISNARAITRCRMSFPASEQLHAPQTQQYGTLCAATAASRPHLRTTLQLSSAQALDFA